MRTILGVGAGVFLSCGVLLVSVGFWVIPAFMEKNGRITRDTLRELEDLLSRMEKEGARVQDHEKRKEVWREEEDKLVSREREADEIARQSIIVGAGFIMFNTLLILALVILEKKDRNKLLSKGASSEGGTPPLQT